MFQEHALDLLVVFHHITISVGKHNLLHVNVFRGIIVLVRLRHLVLDFFFQSLTTAARGPSDETILLAEPKAAHVDAADIWCCPGIITTDGAGSFRPARHAGPKVSGVDVWTNPTDSLDKATLEACRQGCRKHGPVKDGAVRQIQSA